MFLGGWGRTGSFLRFIPGGRVSKQRCQQGFRNLNDLSKSWSGRPAPNYDYGVVYEGKRPFQRGAVYFA